MERRLQGKHNLHSEESVPRTKVMLILHVATLSMRVRHFDRKGLHQLQNSFMLKHMTMLNSSIARGSTGKGEACMVRNVLQNINYANNTYLPLEGCISPQPYAWYTHNCFSPHLSTELRYDHPS